MNRRHILTAISLTILSLSPSAADLRPSPATLIPEKSSIIRGYACADTVISRMTSAPLHRVEGLWRFPADGGTIAIEHCNLSSSGTLAEAYTYRMVIIESSNRNLRPGTIMGYLWATSKRDIYQARIYTSASDDGTCLSGLKPFTLTLSDQDSRLNFKAHRKALKLNLWRMLPYMFRFSVSKVDDTPRDLDGCVRIFPRPAIPAEPRYL